MAEPDEHPGLRVPPKGPSDERRDNIVTIAHEMFLASGYAGTSMSAIAARLGGSKGTLYNYFTSKEELFSAVIERKCEQFLSVLYEAEIAGAELGAALACFGQRFLSLVLSDDSIATYRLVTAECPRFPEIGQAIWKAGPTRGRERLSEFLSHARDAGYLRADADIEIAADQFFALCLSSLQQRRVWMVMPVPTEEEIRVHVEAAVSTFLRAFGNAQR